ncbi:TetR/AcrR family transcriptional regulator [soil metagenome]
MPWVADVAEVEPDGRKRKGARSRAAILERAMAIASTEGLEGLSIGRLATDLGASKSGVFAQFGSKEELQLATVDAARGVFIATSVLPALEGPPGIRRLWALARCFADYAGKVFEGGCFFQAAAAEFDSRPGRVRDAVAAGLADWRRLHVDTIREGQALGEIRPEVDAELLAYELDAYARLANTDSLLHDDAGAFDHARRATLERLRSVTTDPDLLPSTAAPRGASR